MFTVRRCGEWNPRREAWRSTSFVQSYLRPMRRKLRDVQVQAHDQRQRIGTAASDTCSARVSLLFLRVSSLRLDTCDFGYINVFYVKTKLDSLFFKHIRNWIKKLKRIKVFGSYFVFCFWENLNYCYWSIVIVLFWNKYLGYSKYY